MFESLLVMGAALTSTSSRGSGADLDEMSQSFKEPEPELTVERTDIGNGLFLENLSEDGKFVGAGIVDASGKKVGPCWKYDKAKETYEFAMYNPDGILDGSYLRLTDFEPPLSPYMRVEEAGFYKNGKKDGHWIKIFPNSFRKNNNFAFIETKYKEDQWDGEHFYNISKDEYEKIIQQMEGDIDALTEDGSGHRQDLMREVVKSLQKVQSKTLSRRSYHQGEQRIEEHYQTVDGKPQMYQTLIFEKGRHDIKETRTYNQAGCLVRLQKADGATYEYDLKGRLTRYKKDGDTIEYYPDGTIRKKTHKDKIWEFDEDGKTVKMAVRGKVYDFEKDPQALQKLKEDNKLLKKEDRKERRAKLKGILAQRKAQGRGKKNFLDRMLGR